MKKNLPLEELVLTLLALAEAAPGLGAEALASLAGFADELESEQEGFDPTDEGSLLDLLSLIQVDIVTELYHNSAFQEAKIAWDQQLTVRVGLELDEWDAIDNPEQAISDSVAGDIPPLPPAPTALQRLGKTVSEALRDPQSFAQNNQTVQRLASLVRLRWPR